MPIGKQIRFACVLVFALLTTAAAQDSDAAQGTSPTITAAASGERVRITAPSSIVRLHVEVTLPASRQTARWLSKQCLFNNTGTRLVSSEPQHSSEGDQTCIQ